MSNGLEISQIIKEFARERRIDLESDHYTTSSIVVVMKGWGY